MGRESVSVSVCVCVSSFSCLIIDLRCSWTDQDQTWWKDKSIPTSQFTEKVIMIAFMIKTQASSYEQKQA